MVVYKVVRMSICHDMHRVFYILLSFKVAALLAVFYRGTCRGRVRDNASSSNDSIVLLCDAFILEALLCSNGRDSGKSLDGLFSHLRGYFLLSYPIRPF